MNDNIYMYTYVCILAPLCIYSTRITTHKQLHSSIAYRKYQLSRATFECLQFGNTYLFFCVVFVIVLLLVCWYAHCFIVFCSFSFCKLLCDVIMWRCYVASQLFLPIYAKTCALKCRGVWWTLFQRFLSLFNWRFLNAHGRDIMDNMEGSVWMCSNSYYFLLLFKLRWLINFCDNMRSTIIGHLHQNVKKFFRFEHWLFPKKFLHLPKADF